MLPKTMKAIVLTAHGGLDKLVYRDDVPVPACAAGDVLIEVTACGLNNTDVWVREGAYGTDDDPKASAVEALNLKPRLVPGSRENLKVTYAEDLAIAQSILERRA